MKSDPAGTTVMFQTIAGRVSTAATGASDSYTGTLTQKITSQQSTESSLTKQISEPAYHLTHFRIRLRSVVSL